MTTEERKIKARFYSKRYYEKNKDIIFIKNKNWRDNNRDKIKEYNASEERKKHLRERYILNLDKMRKYRKEYDARDYVKLKRKQWYQEYKQTTKYKIASTLARIQRRARMKLDKNSIKVVNEWLSKLKNKKRFRCYWCDKVYEIYNLHIDHIIPLSKGGKNNIENLVASCRLCNQTKNRKDYAQWMNEINNKTNEQMRFAI